MSDFYLQNRLNELERRKEIIQQKIDLIKKDLKEYKLQRKNWENERR